jgi:hypothetical protein
MIDKKLQEELEGIINETPIYTLSPEVKKRQERKAKKVWGLYGSQKKREARGPWEKGYQSTSQYPKDYMLKMKENIVSELEREFAGYKKKRPFRKFGKVRRQTGLVKRDQTIQQAIRTPILGPGRKQTWMP